MKKLTHILSLFLFIGFTLPILGQEQQPVTDEETLSETQVIAKSAEDFISMYYVTYTGDQNAELQNISQQIFGLFGEHFKGILNQLELDWMGIVAPAKEFKNKTGVHLYVKPTILTMGTERFESTRNNFEKWNKKRIETPVAPYLIINPIITGSESKGYQVEIQTVVSDDINPKKYKLKVDAKNVFNTAFKNWGSRDRKKLVRDLKSSLLNGMEVWQEAMGDEFVAAVGINLNTERFASGETISASDRDGYWEQIEATYPDGTPIRSDSVNWEIIPTDALSEEIIEKNRAFNEKNRSNWSVYNPKGASYKIQADIIKITNTNPLLLPSFAKYDYTYWEPKAIVGKNECLVTYEVISINSNSLSIVQRFNAYKTDIEYIQSFANHPDINEVPEFTETVKVLVSDVVTIAEFIANTDLGSANEKLKISKDKSDGLKVKLDALKKVGNQIADAAATTADLFKKLPPILARVVDSLSINLGNQSAKKAKERNKEELSLLELCYQTRLSIEKSAKTQEIFTMNDTEEKPEDEEVDALPLPDDEHYQKIKQGYVRMRKLNIDAMFEVLKKLSYVSFTNKEMFDKLLARTVQDLPTEAPALVVQITAVSNADDENKLIEPVSKYLFNKMDAIIEEEKGDFTSKANETLDNSQAELDLNTFIGTYVKNEILPKFN